MASDISAVSICSSALIKLGNEPITSLNDDNKPARLCSARYAPLRNAVLEAHDWGFATKTVELAPLVGVTIDFDWAYAYEPPADLLKMLRLEDYFDDYEIFNQILYADRNPLKIKYIWLNKNEASYSYSFAECVAWRMAADLAYALTNSTTISDSMAKGYEMELKVARYNDAHRKTPQPLISEDFIRSRF